MCGLLHTCVDRGEDHISIVVSRIAKTLNQMCEWLDPQREACVVREISKKFETYHRGTLESLKQYFEQHDAKGEIVLLVIHAVLRPLLAI